MEASTCDMLDARKSIKWKGKIFSRPVAKNRQAVNERREGGGKGE